MKLGLILTVILIIPLSSALQISEIMYDLEGADAGNEWIEVFNDGESMDICVHRLFEAETNHYIKGDFCTLESGSYVILADRAENLAFESNVLDSAFSLSNTGERLCIRNNAGEDLVCVEYSATLGAKGDGNSLQLSGGEWCTGVPTPGKLGDCRASIEEPAESVKLEDTEVLDLEEQAPEEQKQDVVVSEPDPVKEPAVAVLSAPQIEAPVTGQIIYKSKSERASNVPILMLLTVSITLNVFFIISRLR
ncbi:lamin tail domain-containing protein [Candidatus Woesearchaeota archaeon]|jgi:hypothetical protein|nr:lamin tail domain-containing protein [Candidatus Woesearchaeota archaeon]MBT4248005.1 lamin tail domain-containing protein [Candidatus Woesearchaeota archaeon]